ncbi:hypothetical protein CWI83_09595 [Pseudidiomarina taiwanensis]|uniref:Uncharacterized protein n=1 Tax=Pseudidiomarina taiwanensis TaxID=337250 RepID=A0A432ZCF9_9GAMM|nr:hypothetical protein CWI83_09595 [Pseudidiomarina taiwanensis]
MTYWLRSKGSENRVMGNKQLIATLVFKVALFSKSSEFTSLATDVTTQVHSGGLVILAHTVTMIYSLLLVRLLYW